MTVFAGGHSCGIARMFALQTDGLRMKPGACLLLLLPAPGAYACLTQRITSRIVAFFPAISMPTR